MDRAPRREHRPDRLSRLFTTDGNSDPGEERPVPGRWREGERFRNDGQRARVLDAEDLSIPRGRRAEIVGWSYAFLRIPFMIAFTAASSLRAAATASVRTNFEALAGPAALWIASRSSSVRRNAKTKRSANSSCVDSVCPAISGAAAWATGFWAFLLFGAAGAFGVVAYCTASRMSRSISEVASAERAGSAVVPRSPWSPISSMSSFISAISRT